MTDHRTCDRCGAIGTDAAPVTIEHRYLGGRGYVEFHWCADEAACRASIAPQTRIAVRA